MSILCGYGALLALAYFFQGRLIFFPDRQNFKSCPLILKRGGQAIETIVDGERLRYYLKHNEQNHAWVIHFHGNSGSACDRSDYFNKLSELPVNIVISEYPGFANDTEPPHQDRLLSNAKALMKHVATTLNPDHLPVFLYGESLGTGVATFVASQFKSSGLILQCPYSSVADIGQGHYPFLPVKWLIRQRFEAEEWAPHVKSPVLILHGSADRTIPISTGRKQAGNFKSPVKFVEIHGAGHSDLYAVDPSTYWGSVFQFIRENGLPDS